MEDQTTNYMTKLSNEDILNDWLLSTTWINKVNENKIPFI